MNVLDGLQNIRERLVENDAETATLATVDLFIKRASLSEAKNATVNSQLQLVRMLMRTPESNTNVRVYNEKTATVPSSIIAGMFNFEPAEFYEAEEAAREDVKVSFGNDAPAPPPATPAP